MEEKFERKKNRRKQISHRHFYFQNEEKIWVHHCVCMHGHGMECDAVIRHVSGTARFAYIIQSKQDGNNIKNIYKHDSKLLLFISWSIKALE